MPTTNTMNEMVDEWNGGHSPPYAFMSIRVEFFGVARQRAGTASIEIEAGTLGEALNAAADRLPEFGRACVAGVRLQPAFIANVNGEFFTSDPAAPLADGDSLLILSADAGG